MTEAARVRVGSGARIALGIASVGCGACIGANLSLRRRLRGHGGGQDEEGEEDDDDDDDDGDKGEEHD